MSLDSINSVAPLLTVIIVAATAIAALVQLKHMRAGNQITAMLSIGEEFSGKFYADASNLIRDKLSTAMEDPVYREYEAAMSAGWQAPQVGPDYVELRRAGIVVGNAFEELGILVKRGIIDREMFLDRYCWLIYNNWKRMEPVTALGRAALGNELPWENFEYIAVLSEDWLTKHEKIGTYPHGVRRMELKYPWPLPVAPSTASASR
ncbi:MAG TPA: hypothetical protein VEV38_13855 [Candidatus Eremiobacteraceae bacterium]|nr:hypothetical protein [Candidatus Eremiobacteraceae bacterium]